MTESCFYIGSVAHARHGAIAHRLRYRVLYAYVDLDALACGESPSPLLGFDRAALMSVLSRDHGDGDGPDLAGWVRRRLEEDGETRSAARIMLLTIPRMFGYVFNPVSFYFVHDVNGKLFRVLSEVNNTYGERALYLLDVDSDEEILSATCRKSFHVSPFLPDDGRYEFRFAPPSQALSIAISYYDADGKKALTATLCGARRAITARECLIQLMAFPLTTFGVSVAILWEAGRIALKGAQFRRYRPQRARA